MNTNLAGFSEKFRFFQIKVFLHEKKATQDEPGFPLHVYTSGGNSASMLRQKYKRLKAFRRKLRFFNEALKAEDF